MQSMTPDTRQNNPVNSRILSLDAFRGLTIAGMIIVNNQGDWQHVYKPLKHASWHGWLGADVIFPFFLFICGVSIAISFSKKSDAEINNSFFLKKIVIRSILIFLLGLIINLFPDFNFYNFRIPGVLQRIAVCYLISSIIFIYFREKIQFLITISILAVYYLLLQYFPSCDESASCDPFSPLQNFCRTVDINILGIHTYKNGTAPGLDPEGILSTLPSIASAIAGVIFGKMFLSGKKFSLMILTGTVLIFSGLFLDKIIPINKILWTPSYVLLMAGLASVMFLLFSLLIDSRKNILWSKPFIFLGKNALAIFFISTLLAKLSVHLKFMKEDGSIISLKMILYKNISDHMSSYNASLTYSLIYLSIWMIAAYVLHRKNIIIKI